MFFKPPQNKLANPFYYPLNEAQRYVQEAVTVDIEFKKDADGAAAVGSETGRRGLVVSGKKVKDKVYKMTFTNNAMMNKFMDKYENKLNEEKVEIPANVKKIAKELDDAVELHSSQSERLKDAGIEDNEDMPKGVRDIPKELDKAVAKHKTQADRLRKSGVSEGIKMSLDKREDTELEEGTPEYRAMMKR